MPALPIREWVEALAGLYDQFGYVIVLLGTLFENTALLGLFLPGNALALLGAFYARQGTLNLGWVIFFASLGTLLGYHVDYALGRFALAHVITRWGKSRWGKRLRLAGRIRLSCTFLKRHGGKAIVLSHAIGHMRSFVAITAGLTRMKYQRFLVFEIVAAVLWNTIYSLLGYLLAIEFERLLLVIERAGWFMLALVIVLFLMWRLWRKKKRVSGRRLQVARS